MKHMDDSSSHERGRSDDSSCRSAFSGRCLDIDEDSPFSDLSAVYACSDQAQFAALEATSGIFVREVAHYLGLAGPDLTIPYDFAPLAETVRRHSGGQSPRVASTAEAPAGRAKPPTSSTSKRKKDRGAGRRTRREQREAREHPDPLPDFPAYSPTSTFNGWTHQYAWAEDISEYSVLLGATTSGAYKHITSAMTLVHGLPRFHQRCNEGDFTIEHVAFVTRRCRDVAFRYLPSIDDYLADRRADITIETFKRSLALKIAATQPAQETLEKVAARRRVDISTGDDGTAYLTLTGPAPELHACYRRVEAFARAVYTGNAAAFGDQLRPGETFDDERGIDALMLDIFTRTRPQLKLRITSNNTTTGDTSSTDFPIDGLFAGPDGVSMSPEESLLDYIERTFGQMGDETSAPADADSQDRPASDSEADAQDRTAPDYWLRDPRFYEALKNSRPAPGSAFCPPGPDPQASYGTDSSCAQDGSASPVRYEVLLDMPTHEYWLSHQARTTITVPMFTLLSQFFPNSGDGPGTVATQVPGSEANRETPAISEPQEYAEAVGAAQEPASTTSAAKPADEPWAGATVCDLAGMLPDGSPLPADMARRLAGYASTWTRILTDPATGTPLDAKASSYTIPNSIRQPLTAQWMNCTMPGCVRRAEVTEVDHIIPFDHDSPACGGQTRFGNLHPLCKLHHQAKTDRKFSLSMTEPGRIEYIFRHGITTEVLPPDNPINVEHAKLFIKHFATPPPQTAAPPPTATEPEPSPSPAISTSPTTRHRSTEPRTGAASTPTSTETPPATKDRQKTPASADEKPPTVQSQTTQSTTNPNEGSRWPGWVEYVDPFSGQPGQNTKRWFWDSGEQPPF